MMKPATAGQNSGKRSCMTPPTTNTGSIGTTSTSSSSCPVPSPVTHFTRCRSGTSACASGVQAVLRQGVQGDARVRCLAVGQEEHARHTCLRLHPFLLQSRCTCRLPARPPASRLSTQPSHTCRPHQGSLAAPAPQHQCTLAQSAARHPAMAATARASQVHTQAHAWLETSSQAAVSKQLLKPCFYLQSSVTECVCGRPVLSRKALSQRTMTAAVDAAWGAHPAPFPSPVC